MTRAVAERLYLDARYAVRSDPPITSELLTLDSSPAAVATIASCPSWDDAYGTCDHDACERRRAVSRAHLLRSAAHHLRAFRTVPASVCVYRFCSLRGTAHAGTCQEGTTS